ncbi:hypothetical protein AMAG_10762 [Allomyces macrogynus ATCC 38327]|uniref:Uncharacterized protein n=1 Tax=Allomyces macrogynus (strain ATCC 38327) TaxID=578462 RepID=A0A0L0SRG6_ALLM3|nr:hypothetical protein AMAG_10762 [Allomyces macrogynus ATCC 38327]|eukprot:KNE65102.1 hypothetical protein AMAG_10762 [Allomyces macrogynus ATCC 38327]
MLAASPKPPPVTAPDAAAGAANGHATAAPASAADPGSTIAAIKQQLAAARANHAVESTPTDPTTPKDAPTGDDAQHPARTAGPRRRRRSTAPATGAAADAWRDQLANDTELTTSPPTPSSRRPSVEASTQAPVDAAGATAEDHVRRDGKAELESMRFAAGTGWRLPITIFPGTLQVAVPAPPAI